MWSVHTPSLTLPAAEEGGRNVVGAPDIGAIIFVAAVANSV